MAQHDYNIANQSGADFRADLNNALSAIATTNSGATEPSTTYAHQLWVDTSSNVLKIRNGTDSAWITTGISITTSNILTGDLTGNVTGNLTGNVTGNVTGDLTGNADTATTLATARTISLSGDVAGSASFDGSGDITITTTAQIDSIALGTDTTGDYVKSLSGGTGVTVTGGTGEGSTPSVAIGQAVATTDDVTFNIITASEEFIGDLEGGIRFNAKADGALSKGDVVYISGVSGDVPTVGQAKADDASKMPAFGLALSDANDNAALQVVTFGTIEELDTSGVSEGQILYVSTTAGAYTTTAPTGESSQIQNIGKVIRSHAAAGSIKVGGAGRSNATPNLNDGKIFIGNGSNQAVTSTLDTSIVVENTNLYYTQARFDTAFGNKDTDDLSEGTTNLYYTSTRANTDFDTRLATKDTGDLSEGANLYYTTARVNSAFDTRLATKSTSDLTEGTNLYYTQARFDSAFGNKTTADLTENTNLYYTDTRANSAIDTRVTKAFVDALNVQAASVDANSVTLGTDTVGNYIQTITGTANKITVTGSGSESADVTLTLPDDVQIADSLTVAGNLTVNGTLTSLDTTNLDIEDNLFQLNAGLTGSPVNDSGMLINRGNQDNGIFMWDESVDKFTLGLTTADGTSTGNITLNSLGTLVANLEGNVTGTIQTAAQPNITSLGTLTTLTVDDITINGSTISDSGTLTITSGDDFSVDAEGDISLDANGGDIRFKDNGTVVGQFTQDFNNFIIKSAISDEDLIFKGNDGGSEVTALTLDMSDAGTAIFNHDVKVGSGGILMADTLNNRANSANIIYRTGSTTVVGNNATALVVADSGTVSFGSGIDVTGTITSDGLTLGDNTTSEIPIYFNSSSTDFSVGANGNNFILAQTTGDLDTNQLLTVTSSGSVGINETSPLGKLHVKSADSGASADGGADELVIEGSGDSGLSILSGASNYGNILFSDSGDAAAGRIRYEHDNNALNFGTNGSWDRFYINSAGNVGIGTSSPSKKLHIYNTAEADVALLESTQVFSTLAFKSSTNSSTVTVGIDGAGNAAFENKLSSGNMTFVTNGSERMRIDSSGRLGIGTTSPQGKIQVLSGSTPSKANLIIGFNDTSENYFDANTHVFRDGSSNEKLRIDSSGRVGIGTTSPDAPLVVQESSISQSAQANDIAVFERNDTGYIKIYTPATATGGLAFGDAADAFVGAIRYEHSSNNMNFFVNNSERARIDSSGNLLVGTTTVSLYNNSSEVGTRIGDGVLMVNRSANTPAYFNRLSTDGNIVDFRKDGSTVGSIGVAASDNIYFAGGSGSTKGIYINEAAVYPADTGGAVIDNAVALGQSGIRWTNLYLSGGVYANNASGAFLWNAENAHIVFGTNNTERMRIDASGNVGIGTSSPAGSGLHIRKDTLATTNELLRLSNSAGSTTDGVKIVMEVANTSGNGGEIGTVRDGGSFNPYMYFSTSAGVGSSPVERMRITADGTMGFGMSPLGTNNGSAFFDGNVSSKDGFMTTASDLTLLQPSAGNTIFVRDNGNESARIDSSGNVLVGVTSAQDPTSSTTAGHTFYSDGVAIHSRASANALAIQRTGSDGAAVNFFKTNSVVGSISLTSSATTYNTSSDARLKDITGEARGLEVINKLNPVAYNWKADGKADEGLIAQEVQEIVPNAVSQNEDEYYQMDYSKLVTPLIKAVQELSNEVNELKQEIQNLKGE